MTSGKERLVWVSSLLNCRMATQRSFSLTNQILQIRAREPENLICNSPDIPMADKSCFHSLVRQFFHTLDGNIRMGFIRLGTCINIQIEVLEWQSFPSD